MYCAYDVAVPVSLKDSETLKSLGMTGSTIYRTDLNGNIDVISNGKRYSIAVQWASKKRIG